MSVSSCGNVDAGAGRAIGGAGSWASAMLGAKIGDCGGGWFEERSDWIDWVARHGASWSVDRML